MIARFDTMVKDDNLIPADIEIKKMLKQIVPTYNCAELKKMKEEETASNTLVGSGV